MTNAQDDLDLVGMEAWRRALNLSKALFYGEGGPARSVETIRLSSRAVKVSAAGRALHRVADPPAARAAVRGEMTWEMPGRTAVRTGRQTKRALVLPSPLPRRKRYPQVL